MDQPTVVSAASSQLRSNVSRACRTELQLEEDRRRSDHRSSVCSTGTFREDLNDIIGIKAELIGVLGIVGVQSATLRDTGLRFGSRFWAARSRKWLHLLGPPPLQPAMDRTF